MGLKRELDDNPYEPPLTEDYLEAARLYRDRFATDSDFLDALEIWPKCPRCGKRRIARCPVCQNSEDLFPLADQDHFERDPEPINAPAAHRSHCASCLSCASHELDERMIDVVPEETEEEKERIRAMRRILWQNLAGDEPDRYPAVLCNVCSEAFVPVFPRTCKHCEYDFGNGQDDDAQGAGSREVDEFLALKAAEDEAFNADPGRVMWTGFALVAGALLVLAYWFFIL